MARCKLCKSELSRDEEAIYKRLVDRGATNGELLCKHCLAGMLGVAPEAIDRKIEHFKSIGCTLFK